MQKQLSSLYGLHALERDKGWFFEYEFLTPAKSKAIRREVEVLCGELRPHAAGLGGRVWDTAGGVGGAEIV